MKKAVSWGIILGAAVAVVSLLFGLFGWHRTYEMSFVFLAVAISLNVLTVVLCLREGASTESWLSQIKRGVVLGAVASVVIFLSSWLITSVVFPQYFADMAEGYRATFVGMGLSEPEVTQMVAATAATSPIGSALDGVVGTMATSLLVAIIAGAWLRKKG